MNATPTPIAAGPSPWRVTRAEYHRLGVLGFFAGKRVQLIRGEVVVMSPMGSPHAVAVRLAADALEAAFGAGFHARSQLPLAIAGSEPDPDAAVVRGVPRDHAAAHPATALLVVEVSDSTLDFDLTVKAELYAEAGVPEYWVVDLASRTLRVLRDPRPVAGGHSYRLPSVLAESDSVCPLAAPSSAVRVGDLLP